MMTDVKLGYYKDNNKQLEGYVIKMEEGDKDKKGKSYVMYKKGIVIEKDDEVITEIGINCDSSNGYNKGDNEPNNYLIVEEIIFFSSKSVIMFVFYMLSLDIKVILYICIIGIVASGFYISDRD